MIVATAFWLFLISVLVALVAMGGQDGRQLVVACVIASVLTYLANAHLGFEHARSFVLAIDVGLLLVALTLALRSRSYWPMWFAAFHMITVSTHLAQFAFPASVPGIYGNAAGFWALPALGAAVIGVISTAAQGSHSQF